MAVKLMNWAQGGLETSLNTAGFAALCTLHGDLAEAQLAALGGAPVTTARTRRLYRIPHPSEPGAELFVKIQVAPPGVLKPKKWFSYAFQPSPLVREARALAALSALGYRTPDVLAFGGRGRFPGTVRAALITRAVPHAKDLESWLKGEPELDSAAASVRAVRDTLDALHARGLALGGARFRDFLVPVKGAHEPADVTLIDTAGFGAGARKRARDLGQFEAECARFVQSGLLSPSHAARP